MTPMPFFHGLLYYFGGDQLGYRMISVRYTSRVRMRLQSFLAVAVAKVIVSFLTVCDSRPGQQARMNVRAAEGDLSAEAILHGLEIMARISAINAVKFQTHDKSRASDIGQIKISKATPPL